MLCKFLSYINHTLGTVGALTVTMDRHLVEVSGRRALTPPEEAFHIVCHSEYSGLSARGRLGSGDYLRRGLRILPLMKRRLRWRMVSDWEVILTTFLKAPGSRPFPLNRTLMLAVSPGINSSSG